MINLMKFKIFYFFFSLLIIMPGLYFLLTSGLKLGIDFTGGALLEYRFEREILTGDLREQIHSQGIEVGQIIESSDNVYIIRTKPLEQEKISKLKSYLSEKFGNLEERRQEFVGPVVGSE